MTTVQNQTHSTLLGRLPVALFETQEVDLAADECQKLQRQGGLPLSSVCHGGLRLGLTVGTGPALQLVAAYVDGTQMYFGLLWQITRPAWQPVCGIPPWMLLAIDTHWQREAEDISKSLSSIQARSCAGLQDYNALGSLGDRMDRLMSEMRVDGLLHSGF